MIIITRAGRSTAVLAALLATLVAGCGLDKQETPSLTGPSEFALSVTLTASPNQLPRDATSQSTVTITARDAQGRPLAGQRISLTLPVNTPSGTKLSSSEITTDASGHATVVVTAPSQASTGNSIFVTATPVGANLDAVVSRQVSIAVTPANAAPPAITAFTVSPQSPEIGQVATLDASSATDEGVPCNDTCTYAWDFGGEGTATGRIVKKAFTAAGPYVVTLVVTDAAGSTTTHRQTITVTASGQPTTVTITASPNCVVASNCVAGRAVTFTAGAQAAANHRIVSYNWSWGDGSSSQTPATGIQHTYSQPGTYLVRLTVRDDLGQTSEASEVMLIDTGLVAAFSNEPAIAGEETTFDGSASFSRSGSSIELYTWSWGDGTSESSEDPTIDHTFASAGDYTVRLTVTDSLGRTAFTQRVVTVAP